MPKSEDIKPRGKMTAYAFFVQTCREEHKRKHPEEQVVFTEFSRKCADRWKTMSDYEKKRFNMMADSDKKRFETEMAAFNSEGQVQATTKVKPQKKKVKDPNAPKRGLSAFFFFGNDQRANIKEENPEFGITDVAKEIGKRWADIDPNLKAKYEKLAADDKIRYANEKAKYDGKKENGVGSTESDSD